jgi:hypothetical protein
MPKRLPANDPVILNQYNMASYRNKTRCPIQQKDEDIIAGIGPGNWFKVVDGDTVVLNTFLAKQKEIVCVLTSKYK